MGQRYRVLENLHGKSLNHIHIHSGSFAFQSGKLVLRAWLAPDPSALLKASPNSCDATSLVTLMNLVTSL